MKADSRIPVVLSAFFCPGLGQFVQQRWAAGAVLAAGVLAGFFRVMVLAVGNLANYYSLLANPDANPEVNQPSAFILPVSIVALFYLVSLFDILAAQRRKARAFSEEQFRKAMDREQRPEGAGRV